MATVTYRDTNDLAKAPTKATSDVAAVTGGDVILRLPPGLDPGITRGFNALRGDFMGGPVFDHSVDPSPLLYGPDLANPTLCFAPKGVTVMQAQRFLETSDSLAITNQEDYSKAFTVSLSGEYKGIGFAASANSAITHRGSMFTSQHKVYLLNMMASAVYDVRRYSAENLSEEFKAALQDLPANADKDWLEKYVDFFERYGTHYLVSGTFGGTLVLETELDESDWTREDHSEIRAAATAKFRGVVAGGSMKVESDQKVDSKQKGSTVELHHRLYAMGTGVSSTTAEWIRSSWTRPILLLGADNGFPVPVLAPLSDLPLMKEKAALMKQAAERYLTHRRDCLLGTPRVRWSEQEYDEGRPGFVVGNVGKPASSTWATANIDAFGIDDTWGPLRLGKARAIKGEVPYATFAFPTSGGKPYLTDKFGGSLRFIPFGQENDRAFTDIIGIKEEKPAEGTAGMVYEETATCDKFVVGTWDAHGMVTVTVSKAEKAQTKDAQPPIIKLELWTHDNNIGGQGFCLPIPKGHHWRVDEDAAHPRPDLHEIRVTKDFLLGHEYRTDRHEGVVYLADKSDGLLFGYLDTTGTLEVRTDTDQTALHNGMGFCLVRTSSNAQVRNAFMAPIAKSLYYRVMVSGTTDEEWRKHLHLYWIDIGRASNP